VWQSDKSTIENSVQALNTQTHSIMEREARITIIETFGLVLRKSSFSVEHQHGKPIQEESVACFPEHMSDRLETLSERHVQFFMWWSPLRFANNSYKLWIIASTEEFSTPASPHGPMLLSNYTKISVQILSPSAGFEYVVPSDEPHNFPFAWTRDWPRRQITYKQIDLSLAQRIADDLSTLHVPPTP
jgi:hypothetical protein